MTSMTSSYVSSDSQVSRKQRSSLWPRSGLMHFCSYHLCDLSAGQALPGIAIAWPSYHEGSLVRHWGRHLEAGAMFLPPFQHTDRVVRGHVPAL